MPTQDVVVAITIGFALIVMGLSPELLQRLSDGMRSFSESLRGSTTFPHRSDYEFLTKQMWLVYLGLVFILLGLWVYFSS